MRPRHVPGALASLLFGAVCMAADLPGDSIYQLHAQLTTQTAESAGLDLYRGHPTLIGMFYGSCPAACPMLITAMQVCESRLDEAAQARLRVLLVSFDAARDTPVQLDRLARLHRTDSARWTFSSADEADARRIAAALGVSYRRLPGGDFDHSLRITLLDENGRIVAATTTLIGDQDFAAKLRSATQAPARAR
ncbi:MAG TPA: SCO family protein [Steroidobacteraceae bacterium]|nr:SCO family protein [Steroidobacteraceae bacterium]